MMTTELALEHRQVASTVANLAVLEFRDIIASIDTEPPETIRDVLMDTLPAVAATHGETAAALAMDYYDEARVIAEARGSFQVVPAELPDDGRFDALVRWGLTPVFASEPDMAAAAARIAGGLQRTVLDMSRSTIADNSVRDPSAAGWSRVARPDACAFCQMLSGRGFVYTELTVQFKSHDNCHCAAAPSWDAGAPVAVGVPFVASRRNITAKDRQRVKDYLRSQS